MRVHRLLVVAAVAVVVPAACRAQGYPPSQRGSVTQNVALTEIAVTYGRPVARGRTLFGTLVPWDSVWHPGADSATRISFSHDVVLEGHDVKAGEYSVWLIPRNVRPWTFILSRASRVFHKPYPGAAEDYLRVDVTPESVSHMESMAIYFASVIKDEAILRIHWGQTALPIRIRAPFRPAEKLPAGALPGPRALPEIGDRTDDSESQALLKSARINRKKRER